MTTILYIDKSSLFAGAEASLLALVQSLDRARYRPVVLADYPQPHHDRFKDAGVDVVCRTDALKWWMGSDRWRRPIRGTDVLKRLIYAQALARIIRSLRV